jgi:ubiquinone/menaquinone biosynthesis C-methylase UbiE
MCATEKGMFDRLTRAAACALFVALSAALSAAPQLGSRSADEWIKVLESPGRVGNVNVDEIVTRLHLEPGQVVADLGAGAGLFELPLSRAVGPTGKVYAVDIEQKLLDHIAAKMKEAGAANVRPLLGQFGDPKLPAADVDVAFMHDVLHHVQDRAGYIKQAARYLKPGGRFAIVEPDAKRGPHANDPNLQVTREQLAGWMKDAGLVLVREFPVGETAWYAIYSRK